MSPRPGREPEVAELNYLQGHMIEATLHFPAYNVFNTPVKNVSRCLATPMNDDATQHWVEHYGKLNLDLNSLGR